MFSTFSAIAGLPTKQHREFLLADLNFRWQKKIEIYWTTNELELGVWGQNHFVLWGLKRNNEEFIIPFFLLFSNYFAYKDITARRTVPFSDRLILLFTALYSHSVNYNSTLTFYSLTVTSSKERKLSNLITTWITYLIKEPKVWNSCGRTNYRCQMWFSKISNNF